MSELSISPLAQRDGARRNATDSFAARRSIRVAVLTLTGVILVFAALELVATAEAFDARGEIGLDIGRYYTGYARDWLAGRPVYGPNQLSGPYDVLEGDGMLFPPTVLYLFAAFTVLPLPLWWVIPGAAYVACFVRYRPSLWTFPVLALIVFWPRTVGQLVVGGSDLWVGAAVAAGLIYGWPFALILVKPSYVPLALLGVRRRSWWIAACILAAVSIPLGTLWLDYLTAMRNFQAPLTYSLPALPLVLAPLVMWLGRTRERG